jgi:transcriptional regulator with XRE-family HTH domain
MIGDDRTSVRFVARYSCPDWSASSTVRIGLCWPAGRHLRAGRAAAGPSAAARRRPNSLWVDKWPRKPRRTGDCDTSWMSDQRLGSAIRLVRVRRGWRQSDLARRSGVGQATISRIERGHVGTLSLDRLRAVAATLDIRVDVLGRWRAGDLDRLLNGGHSRLHESVARAFRDLPEWITAPEVSFAVYGERGVIDILAWHPRLHALLVIELKTDIADVNELIGTADRKRRLAVRVAIERGWIAAGDVPSSISLWIIVAGTRTNRRRLAAHAAMLRAAFPTDGRTIAGWLTNPSGSLSALSMWPDIHRGTSRPVRGPIRRVRRRD